MDHTKSLTDSLTITEGLSRSGNSIALSFIEVLAIVVTLNGAYKIKRVADTAFARTNYP
jgi:hypothetical protein